MIVKANLPQYFQIYIQEYNDDEHETVEGKKFFRDK
jgi:hypothetical protein